jgi:phosphatidylglycerophosphate synthase
LPEPVGLAFKNYEIEELADVHFFRPLGMLFARAARSLGLTPTTVTIVGAGAGVLGGALLYDERLGLVAFAVIILHSILDSSDGQLARMTGHVTEFGRMLDGLGGYITHTAIFVAIAAGAIARGAVLTPWTSSIATSIPAGLVVTVMFLAGAATMVHAQMYDYHRTSYARAVIKGMAVAPAVSSSRGIVGVYESMQRALSGRHARVEASIAARAVNGMVRDADRARYRSCFYWPVRGWNALGDNTRFYAIGALACTYHPEWLFAFVLVPMNAIFVLLWLWQARADRRFLAGL